MEVSQEEHTKETRMKIYQDIFSKMEKGFEDLLLPEYAEIKNAILNLMDKDPDKLRKVMYTISNMTIEDMYEYIIRLETTRKQEYKANNMTKCLEKIKARREEINKDSERDEETKEERSNDQTQPTSNAKDEKNEQEQETSNDEEKRKLEKELKSMFRHKEERFEDILIHAYEYEYFKRDIFKLLDKDLDSVKSIMNEMRNMTLSDIYSKMLETAQKSGQERKEKYISKTLRKIKQRDIEIKKEAEEKAKKEEELKNYKNKDDKRSKNNKDRKTSQDKKDGKDSKNREGKKPYEKTTIEVDTQHNKIVICVKGKTRSYKVSKSESVKQYIKNGKEYKKDKQYKKIFDKKALKKVDPAILGLLIGEGDMDAAKEYVNAFKSEKASSIDLKYTFGEYYEANVPMKAISNYETYAKKAAKNAEATVEGLKKGPIGRFMDWRNARKAKKLEAAKEGKPTFGEKVQTDEFGEERDEKIAGYKGAKQKSNVEHVDPNHEKGQESKSKNNFKDEMSKGAPSPEKQAETAKEFERKGKAQKREPKAIRKIQEEVK